MIECVQRRAFLRTRKRRADKHQRMLEKMAAWRAAKARKRRQRIAEGWSPEPKMVRSPRFEFGVRDTVTGDVGWVPFRSVRDAIRRLQLIRKYCE